MTGRVQAAAEKLLDQLEQAIGELNRGTETRKERKKTENGEIITEIVKVLPREKAAVDKAGLKQLTSVLKELQDILLKDPTIEQREREARIRRLEQELNRVPQEEGITVVLEGEVAEYAE